MTDTAEITSPISGLDASDDQDSSIDEAERQIRRDISRTSVQKSESITIPNKLDYYNLYYRSSGMPWMCSCTLHLNPRDAIQEMQNLKTSYNQFNMVKITLPV